MSWFYFLMMYVDIVFEYQQIKIFNMEYQEHS